MADNTNNLPYPFQFDPSQWANPYSAYKGAAFPATQYSGGATGPTDAHGNPIGSYQAAIAAQKAAQAAQAPASMPPSTTLDSTSAQLAALRQADANGQAGITSQMAAAGIGSMDQARALRSQMAAGGSSQPAAPAAPAAPAGPDMSAAYLAALQNPGHVTTPGANVPQSPTPSGQSNVLQQFLANWNQKGQPTQGAGNYNNAGFYNALQGNV